MARIPESSFSLLREIIKNPGILDKCQSMGVEYGPNKKGIKWKK